MSIFWWAEIYLFFKMEVQFASKLLFRWHLTECVRNESVLLAIDSVYRLHDSHFKQCFCWLPVNFLDGSPTSLRRRKENPEWRVGEEGWWLESFLTLKLGSVTSLGWDFVSLDEINKNITSPVSCAPGSLLAHEMIILFLSPWLLVTCAFEARAALHSVSWAAPCPRWSLSQLELLGNDNNVEE